MEGVEMCVMQLIPNRALKDTISAAHAVPVPVPAPAPAPAATEATKPPADIAAPPPPAEVVELPASPSSTSVDEQHRNKPEDEHPTVQPTSRAAPGDVSVAASAGGGLVDTFESLGITASNMQEQVEEEQVEEEQVDEEQVLEEQVQEEQVQEEQVQEVQELATATATATPTATAEMDVAGGVVTSACISADDGAGAEEVGEGEKDDQFARVVVPGFNTPLPSTVSNSDEGARITNDNHPDEYADGIGDGGDADEDANCASPSLQGGGRRDEDASVAITLEAADFNLSVDITSVQSIGMLTSPAPTSEPDVPAAMLAPAPPAGPNGAEVGGVADAAVPPLPRHESYDLSGLQSDASTDPEDSPLHQVPDWAATENLQDAIATQETNADILVFGKAATSTPDLDELEVAMGFGNSKKSIDDRKKRKANKQKTLIHGENAGEKVSADAFCPMDKGARDAGDVAMAPSTGDGVGQEVAPLPVSARSSGRASSPSPSYASVEHECRGLAQSSPRFEGHGQANANIQATRGPTKLQLRFEAAMQRHGWNSDPSVATMLLARAASLRNTKQATVEVDADAGDVVEGGENNVVNSSAGSPAPLTNSNTSTADLADALASQLDLNTPFSPEAKDEEAEATDSDVVAVDDDDGSVVDPGTRSSPKSGNGRRRRIGAAVISSSSEDDADADPDPDARVGRNKRRSSPKQPTAPSTAQRQQRWRRQISSSSSGGESDDDNDASAASPSLAPSSRHARGARAAPRTIAAAAAARLDTSGTYSSDGGNYCDSNDDDDDDDEDDSFIVDDSADEGDDSDNSFIVNDEEDEGELQSNENEGIQDRTGRAARLSLSRSPMTPLQNNGGGGGSGNGDSFRTPPSPGISWTTPPPASSYATPARTQPTPARTKIMPYTTPKPMKQLKDFAKKREGLALALYTEFNKQAFGGKLPQGYMAAQGKRGAGSAETVLGMLGLSWSKTLNTTAGTTQLVRRGGVYSASIQLSTKVVDTMEKLRNTLCHEMCHAAAWLISHVSKPPHGDVFYSWATIAMQAYPDLAIATCHTYDINFKHQYQCQTCRKVYGRHSKSIKIQFQRCGVCKGPLVLLPKLKADGTPMKQRVASKWQLFCSSNMALVKAQNPGSLHKDVMAILSRECRRKQEA